MLFVCLDEVGGMMFNKRRQSKDCMIRKDIFQMIKEESLYVNGYTAKQFTEEEQGRLIVDEDCLAHVKDGYVFVENAEISAYGDQIEEIVVYRWKRTYPADFFCDIDLSTSDWELISTEEFVGNSHEVIGKEIYRKK